MKKLSKLKLGVIIFITFIVGVGVGTMGSKSSTPSKTATVQTSTEEQKEPSSPPLPLLSPSPIPTYTLAPTQQPAKVRTQPNPTAPQKPPTSTGFEISGVVAKQESGTTIVYGEVKNNDSAKHSLSLKTTFYDAGGKILGTAAGAVNDLAAGDTKTFTLMGIDNVEGYANMKTQVDSSF